MNDPLRLLLHNAEQKSWLDS